MDDNSSLVGILNAIKKDKYLAFVWWLGITLVIVLGTAIAELLGG